MIYLDNAATTKPSKEAVAAATLMMSTYYANPSSLHDAGIEVEKKVEEARGVIANACGVEKECLYFTGSGTISDNIAILGYLQNKRTGRIITSSYEHPAVLECFKALENRFEVVYLNPVNGIITSELVDDALTPDTIFVSIMHVNNETGAVTPISEISTILKRKGIVFHTDAIQSFLKVQDKNNKTFNYSCVDMCSISGHKTHGPKGIGALYIKKGIKVKPVIYGGGQEKNVYSGTYNSAGIVSWASAVNNQIENFEKNLSYIKELNKKTRNMVEKLGGIIISPDNSSPYVLNVAFKEYISENILHYLSSRGIYVSTGAACSSKKGSSIMKALKLEKYQKNTLRISFSYENTEAEIDVLKQTLKSALNEIIKVK